ncbi:MAG: ShlB/FhaC/HecB family hemolysin secretion/activation protein [Proteobacteria bacterium]|nr:ShlB/FhaC/HecB family hemolysin secretion/activation protein [Pseudomonadota bacterium]
MTAPRPAAGPFLPLLSALPVALCAALPVAALGQVVPDAGGALREATPPARVIPPTPEIKGMPAPPPAAVTAPAGGPSFVLKGVRFSGSTLFSADALQALVADRVGQAVTLADLEALAERVTERYRQDGYLLAQAVVPVQEFGDGIVEMSVIEGTLGKVTLQVDPAARVEPQVLERILARLEPGQPLHGPTLERVMLLLSDLPGLAPQAALEQGDLAGTTDLIVTVGPRRNWSLILDADNYGSRASSEYRVGATGRLNGPLRLGDNLDARAQFGAAGRLAYGRLSYELPLGGNGTRLGASYSQVDYELGKDFSVLDASGRADVFELSLSHPIIRSRSRNLFARLGWQRKDLDDRIGLISRRDEKSVRTVFAGLAYEQRDNLLGGGYTSGALTAFFGDLDLGGVARAEDRTGRRTEGSFQHWNYELSRLNQLVGPLNLFFGMTGQFADRNLTSAEKVSLGGPRAVRAYAPAEATVDEGHVANLELRYSVTPDLSLQGFYDWGWGKFNRKPAPGEVGNNVTLRGYGVGAFWGTADGFILRTSLAWRVTDRGVTDPDRVPRLYMQVSKSF